MYTTTKKLLSQRTLLIKLWPVIGARFLPSLYYSVVGLAERCNQWILVLRALVFFVVAEAERPLWILGHISGQTELVYQPLWRWTAFPCLDDGGLRDPGPAGFYPHIHGDSNHHVSKLTDRSRGVLSKLRWKCNTIQMLLWLIASISSHLQLDSEQEGAAFGQGFWLSSGPASDSDFRSYLPALWSALADCRHCALGDSRECTDSHEQSHCPWREAHDPRS